MTAAVSQQLWTSSGALVQRAQEPNIPFRESLTSIFWKSLGMDGQSGQCHSWSKVHMQTVHCTYFWPQASSPHIQDLDYQPVDFKTDFSIF